MFPLKAKSCTNLVQIPFTQNPDKVLFIVTTLSTLKISQFPSRGHATSRPSSACVTLLRHPLFIMHVHNTLRISRKCHG